MSRKGAKNASKSTLGQCVYCTDDSSLEEVIALTEESVQHDGLIEEGELQFAIRHFVIHTKHALCSLEDGHIELGQEVYVCGLLGALVSEVNQNDSGTVPVKMIGPLNEWWFSGFDGGDDLLLGVDSPYANYHLRGAAHYTYQGHFKTLNQKMHLTKCIIETITENPDFNLEEMLHSVSHRLEDFDNETFFASLQFVIRQIHSYDQHCDSDEIHLSETVAFKAMQQLAGASVIADDSGQYSPRAFSGAQRKRKFIKQLYTPISESIVNSIFSDILKNSKKTVEGTFQAVARELEAGAFICFKVNEKVTYGRIISLPTNKHMIHINIFRLGTETLLGETSPQQFLYATRECLSIQERLPVASINVRLSISEGTDECTKGLSDYTCYQVFDQKACSFENLPPDYCTDLIPPCFGCLTKKALIPLVTSLENNFFEVAYSGMNLRPGDSVAFEADLNLPLFDYFKSERTHPNSKLVDSRLYPEKYRKFFSKDVQRDCYQFGDLSQFYQIGCIREIRPQSGNVLLQVNVFFRPQNVFSEYRQFLESDLNVLFWSDLKVTIRVTQVHRKCQVIYAGSTNSLLDVFYFNTCYDTLTGQMSEPSEQLKCQFKPFKDITVKHGSLRILDLFAGCGGLSYGFKLAASVIYAVESDKHAASSFEANFNQAAVLNSDANVILEQLLNGKDQFIKAHLPEKYSLDILIGGPPCQGFSGMNRFSTSEYSLFKSSLIASFLNYVEYFRPKTFLLENVRNLALYRNSLLLKMICSFFVRLGYQIRVAILHAGFYGVPQNRRRLFIVGAAPGIPLPVFPPQTHVFSQKHSDTSFKVDGIKYDSVREKLALLRMVTIEDAITDLPPIDKKNYSLQTTRQYAALNGNLLHYQRLLRASSTQVNDHFCKETSQLNFQRIRHIPLDPGSDWRDLPNIEIQLEDGTMIRKLQYKYGKGVCRCAQANGPCSGSACRQEGTLIPWCLVHTAHRHNHWPGVFGRLAWKGFFPTIVTNPDPISVQGRVIHPQQNRVLSVREQARAQGFPDDFTFVGPIEHKYRQIGNAVPPILSKAIAKQFIQCLVDSIPC